MPHINQDIVPILAALRSAQYQHCQEAEMRPRPPAPFVTISRQAGVGGRSFAARLARRLNERDACEVRWTVWDNELVERVAAEYRLPLSKVAALEDVHPSWLEQAIGSLAVASPPSDEMTVFHRVCTTIRALAEIGRVIIVGRGAAFLTADMPGGVHLRLVAPLERRIEWTARSMGVTSKMAAEQVREKDEARLAFYRRHFQNRSLIPESFTATFNIAAASADRLDASAAALVPAPLLSVGGVAVAATTPGASVSAVNS